MDENLINKIMSIAIETAIKVYEEKKENYFKEQKAQNVQKIKYILKKYRIMKEYMTCNHENISDFQCEEYDEKLILENTIPKVIKQFDRALLILKSVYEKLGQPEDMRCYKIIEELYLSDVPIDKASYLRGEDKISLIAANYNINRRTVYKDIDKASNMLSMLYFGILD